MRAPGLLSGFIIIFAGCGASPKKPPQARPELTAANQAPARPSTGPASVTLRPDPSAVPSSSATRAEIDALIARLRAGEPGERKAVLERLVALGDAARPELERALEDALFDADVLREAIARVRDPAHAPRETDRKQGVASAWVESKYRLALDRFLAGDDLGAQQLVEAILTVEPATTARPRLERLRRQIRDHIVRETIIEAKLELADTVLVPGRPLRAKLRLENKTRETLDLRSSAGTPLGQVVLDYEELEPDGTRALRRTTRPVRPLAQGLTLDPRGKATLELDLPSEHATKPKGVVGRYRLSGILRPGSLQAGEEQIPYFLPIPAVELVVVDADETGLAEKPEASFAKALKDARAAVEAKSEAAREKATREGFTAALVWASQDRDAAVRGIVAALESSEGALERMLTAALARAVGEPGSYTKDEWLAWWKSGASRPRSSRPSSDIDDEEPPPVKLPR